MYKVFFNDRKLILTDNFTKHFQVNYGLFYKYRDLEDLKEIISLYNKLSKIDTLYLFHHDIDKGKPHFFGNQSTMGDCAGCYACNTFDIRIAITDDLYKTIPDRSPDIRIGEGLSVVAIDR